MGDAPARALFRVWAVCDTANVASSLQREADFRRWAVPPQHLGRAAGLLRLRAGAIEPITVASQRPEAQSLLFPARGEILEELVVPAAAVELIVSLAADE